MDACIHHATELPFEQSLCKPRWLLVRQTEMFFLFFFMYRTPCCIPPADMTVLCPHSTARHWSWCTHYNVSQPNAMPISILHAWVLIIRCDGYATTLTCTKHAFVLRSLTQRHRRTMSKLVIFFFFFFLSMVAAQWVHGPARHNTTGRCSLFVASCWMPWILDGMQAHLHDYITL